MQVWHGALSCSLAQQAPPCPCPPQPVPHHPDRAPLGKTLLHRQGMVVQHRRHGYRGVIAQYTRDGCGLLVPSKRMQVRGGAGVGGSVGCSLPAAWRTSGSAVGRKPPFTLLDGNRHPRSFAPPPLLWPQCEIDVDLNALQFGLDAPFFHLLVDQRDRPTGPMPTFVAQASRDGERGWGAWQRGGS